MCMCFNVTIITDFSIEKARKLDNCRTQDKKIHRMKGYFARSNL